jgi:2-C-methyl-D-erythritol 4-phosphate cytidylyltransferase
VVVHDAARPLVSPGLIDAVVEELAAEQDAAAVIAAAPVTDTIKRAGGEDEAGASAGLGTPEASDAALDAALVIEATLDRRRLWAAQTPQVFRTEALRAALEAGAATHGAATDEAMLIEAAGGTVLLHPVSAENFKVTTPLDLRVAELLLAARPAAPDSVPE